MKVDLIIDMQFGSTGKGLLAGYLAKWQPYDTVATAWAPNAGHTYINENGRKFVHMMLANGIVGPTVKRVLIGPGSLLDLDQLKREIVSCMDIIESRNMSIFIHPNACVVTQEDRDDEKETMTAIGSTKKGVGAAAIKKIRRQPGKKVIALDYKDHDVFKIENVVLVKKPIEWIDVLNNVRYALVEGAQGFGLSMSHGFYPYTTSRDISPFQILADCGLPTSVRYDLGVHGTMRTYPIRVGNRFDANGNQVGWSGPHFDDQLELSWHELGLEPELTTVTKLPRRIFSFSRQQYQYATAICDPDVVFLNFVNYLRHPDHFRDIRKSLVGSDNSELAEIVYGYGPTVNDIVTESELRMAGGRNPDSYWRLLLERMNRAI